MVTSTPDHEIHARTQAGEPVVDDDGQPVRVWTTTRLSLLCDTDEETVWEHETTEGPKIQSGWRYGIPFSYVLDGSSAVRVGDNVARAYVVSTERQWRRFQHRTIQALHLTLKSAAERITAGVGGAWMLNEPEGNSVFFERLLESATPPEFALAIRPESES